MTAKLWFSKLELSLTDHCNLSCRGCNHASPHMEKRQTPAETIMRDLSALSRVAGSDDMTVAGGEPLLNPQLLEILTFLRRLGISRRVHLFTNGVLLHKAPKEIFDLIDTLFISVYPGVAHRFDPGHLRRLAADKGVKIVFDNIDKFARNFLNEKNTNDALVDKIFRYCNITRVAQCYLVYEGYFYRCTPAPFMARRLRLAGKDVLEMQDGVPIHDNPNLRQDIETYLSSPRPLDACRYCLGNLGKYRPSQQLNAAELAGERAEPTTDVGALLNKPRMFKAMLRTALRPPRPYRIAPASDDKS